LDNHLEKLLQGSFSPKSLFLAFRKDMERLGDALMERDIGEYFLTKISIPIKRKELKKLLELLLCTIISKKIN
jgi:hypothetical protein